MINLAKATAAIESRGPDFQDIYFDEFVGLGHRRLVIIDPSLEANQPMTDSTRRYYLNFNGEIYNFKALRSGLESKGVHFRSSSDTEVLLYHLIEKGVDGLQDVNGFFAFAFYDSYEKRMLIARDRFGIKPIYYLADADKILFASEMKALFEFGIERNIDYTSLLLYLQLNYIPAPHSILRGVKKLEPGCYLTISETGNAELKRYYDLDLPKNPPATEYSQQVDQLRELLTESVNDRLVADVPLGTFLSGGLDSSIISALVKKNKPDLRTFSIGFKDRSFFDESRYANLVAKHIGSQHESFMLTERDLQEEVESVLDYVDEPFADSSALAVYILSKYTRQQVTVALSGDGADELFGGYNKHSALVRMLSPGTKENLVRNLGFVWDLMPKSRNNPITNRIRQFHRFSKLAGLSAKQSYWDLASFLSERRAVSLINPEYFQEDNLLPAKSDFLRHISDTHPSFSQMLRTDLDLVLPNDMLYKVDSMSMAHGLEIRVPFLDHRLVEFVNGLPDEARTHGKGKVMLKDAFGGFLPKTILNRKKHGFEVPLTRWFKRSMRSKIFDDLLGDEFIEGQALFNPQGVRTLKTKFFSRNPEDAHATIWALAVFQNWFKKYLG